MMDLSDLVTPDAILPSLKANGKKQALQELAARAAVLTGQNERSIFEVLLQREKLGTTAVGYGVALLYALFGAPDLAMTQFAVETLTVVIFVLVF